MVVEVIENPKGKRTTCEECKAKLRYMPKDVIDVYYGANYGGDTPDRYDGLRCPACGELTRII